jgi:hypothetical protein
MAFSLNTTTLIGTVSQYGLRLKDGIATGALEVIEDGYDEKRHICFVPVHIWGKEGAPQASAVPLEPWCSSRVRSSLRKSESSGPWWWRRRSCSSLTPRRRQSMTENKAWCMTEGEGTSRTGVWKHTSCGMVSFPGPEWPCFDMPSWEDGYRRGYQEGDVDGQGRGAEAARQALRDQLLTLGHDVRLGFVHDLARHRLRLCRRCCGR